MAATKFRVARELIRQKKYDAARELLKTIEHPKAKEWLVKLEKLSPQRKKYSWLIPLFGTIVFVAVLVVTGVIFFNSRNQNNVILAVPTVLELPTQTITPTVTVTSTSTIVPVLITRVAMVQHDMPSPIVRPSATITNTVPPTFTSTPRPTNTPRPTSTPRFQSSSQILGPINDTLRDTFFTVEVGVVDVEFTDSVGFSEAGRNREFAIVEVEFTNLGPGSISNLSSFDFNILTDNGVVYNSSYVSDCDFDMVSLQSGASIDGCIAFEVPTSEGLSFIYAPYQYGNLEDGRYLSLRIQY